MFQLKMNLIDEIVAYMHIKMFDFG
jgi:hypothetical protein